MVQVGFFLKANSWRPNISEKLNRIVGCSEWEDIGMMKNELKQWHLYGHNYLSSRFVLCIFGLEATELIYHPDKGW